MRTRMAFKGILSLLPALPLLISCDKAATVGPELDPAPAAMDIVSGNKQSAAAGSELPNPVVVRVLNSSGQPVANQIVNFRVVQGGGSVFAGVSLTNAQGIAQERWELGTTPGVNQILEARAVSSTDGQKQVFATFTATAQNPATVVATVTVTPATASLTAGTTRQLSAVAYNAAGAVLSGKTFTWSSSNTNVATVSSSGLVTAKAAGTATITVGADDGRGKSTITVTAASTGGTGTVAAECAAPKAGWIWCDDFEQNRLSSYFEYDNGGGAFTRVSGVGTNNSYAMRARFTAGMVNAGNLKLAFGRTPTSYMRPVDAGTANYREIYFRVYVKNASTWQGGGGDKFARAIVFAGSNWSEAAIAHVWSGGTGSAANHLHTEPVSGTDTQGNLKTTVYNDGANFRWLGSKTSTTPIFASPNLGKWHCVESRVRLNDAGQSNGVFTLWINGVQEAHTTGLNWVGSYNAYGINSVFLENFWNNGAPRQQDRFFDNFVVSTQRIGCS